MTKVKQTIGALCRTIRKWSPISTFTKLYSATIEPILTYALEAWYPSQAYLQNSVERVKKFAARLATNDFNQSTSYETLLQRLNWKPISHIAMERRAILIFKHVKERNQMPDNAISHVNPSLRRSSRTGNGLELAMPVTTLKTTLCSSLNVAKSIWNSLPKNVVELWDINKFKAIVRSPNLYAELARSNVIRRAEENL